MLLYAQLLKALQTRDTWTSGTEREIEPINCSSSASDCFQVQREPFQLNQRKVFHILRRRACWGPWRGISTSNPFEWYGFFTLSLLNMVQNLVLVLYFLGRKYSNEVNPRLLQLKNKATSCIMPLHGTAITVYPSDKQPDLCSRAILWKSPL
jgi:hypothetical protein